MAVKGSAQGAIFKIGEYSDLLVFLAVILVVVMMVLPMPPLLLDLLLALNISLALLVLLLTMNIQGALQFSIFPSLRSEERRVGKECRCRWSVAPSNTSEQYRCWR